MREKRFGSRINKTFTFDFAGRKVTDELKDSSFEKYATEIEAILNDKKNADYFTNTIAYQEQEMFHPIVIFLCII